MRMRVCANPNYPEMKLIDGVDRIEFKCNKCGNCCRNRGDITLFPQDIPRIAKFLGMKSGDAFLERYTQRSNPKDKPTLYKYTLKDKGDEYRTCIFYNEKNNECKIHQVKPPACFYFPFVTMEDKIEGKVLVQYSTCIKEEALGKGKPFIEYLKENPLYEKEFSLRRRYERLMTRLYIKKYDPMYKAMYRAVSRILFEGYNVTDGEKEILERMDKAEEWASYI